jgi:single-strand DNA-binding protein
MPNLNKVMLMGNLTRDPEVKYTPKGTAICQIGLAVTRTYSVDGEKREETAFIDCESFGKQAETIGEYCKKGRPLYVEGRLKLDTWDDKQSGQKRSKLKVMIESFQFLGSKEGGSSERTDTQSAPPAQRRAPTQAPRPPADPDLDAQPDDIPFAIFFPILIPALTALHLLA